MGLFEDLSGGALQNLFKAKGTGQPDSGMSTLFNSVVGMVTKNGLDSFVKKMANNGLADQVKSWVSTGKNKSISASSLKNVLGQDIISDMAKKTGLKEALVSKSLASMLPEVVNKLTPNGVVDEAEVKKQTKGFDFGDVSDLLGKFFK